MAERPWLDSADPTLREERALLRRLGAEQPPVGSVERGWAALAAEIGVQGAGLAAGHAVAQHTATGVKWALWGKAAAVVGLAGGVAFTGAQLLQNEPAVVAPPVAHAPHAPAAAPSPVVTPPAADTAPAESTPNLDKPRAPSAGSTLAEEGKLLGKARQLVQAGRTREALALLESSAQRYPRSVLSQEREVLTIEALAASGATSVAKQRARRFLDRYPASPYVDRLQRFVE